MEVFKAHFGVELLDSKVVGIWSVHFREREPTSVVTVQGGREGGGRRRRHSQKQTKADGDLAVEVRGGRAKLQI